MDWVGLGRELASWLLGRGSHTLAVVVQCALQLATPLPRPQAQAELQARVEAARTRVATLLGEDGILLCPAHPTTPPRHHQVKLYFKKSMSPKCFPSPTPVPTTSSTRLCSTCWDCPPRWSRWAALPPVCRSGPQPNITMSPWWSVAVHRSVEAGVTVGVSVQLVGGPLQDRLTLALARHLDTETSFTGWVPPWPEL